MKSAAFQKADNKNQSMRSSLFGKNDDVSLAESHDNSFNVSTGPAFNFGDIRRYNPRSSLRVQPKLQIIQPGDKYEQEADAMSDKVMRMSDKDVSQQSFRASKTTVQRKCAECENEDEKKKVQRKPSNDTSQFIAPPIVHDVLNFSSGKTMDKSTRLFMESRFNYDFGSVKIHDNNLAAKSAGAINALAYTSGENIVFSTGKYSPGTESGRRLLAHELTHVVQQITNAQTPKVPEMAYQKHSSVLETEKMIELISSGNQLMVKPATHSQLFRQPNQAPLHPTVFSRFKYYDRSQFGGRFDAEVGTNPHIVTLIMGVDFIPASWSVIDPSEKIAKFKLELKKIIESTWSFKYALKSICEGDEERFQARVRLLIDAPNPHATIFFYPDTPDGRSSAGGAEHGLSGPQAALQESDTFEIEHKRFFQLDKKRPPKEQNFSQAPAAHEFGHLLGLGHIRCPGNEDRCYGLTPKEAVDIMGLGSFISHRDFAPFQQIMKRYGQDTIPALCNDWRLVESG